jgi:hypothetical protein
MSTPSLLNIPYLYKAGTLYSQIPESGAGDFTVSRTTTVANRSTRINKDGLIELVADNVPRLDYPLGGAVNGCPALLVEPSAQNLALQSENFGTTWTRVRINAFGSGSVLNTTATLDPFGTNFADYIQEDTSPNDTHRINQDIAITNGTTYTYTCFIKSAERFQAALYLFNGGVERYGIFNTNAGTATANNATVSIDNFGNGWYRCRVTFTATTTVTQNFRILICDDSGNPQYTGTGTKGIYVFGAQLEVGSVPTSYIPTTTAAVTRSGEIISDTTATALIGQTEGTIYAEIIAFSGVNTSRVISTTESAVPTNNRVLINIDPSHRLEAIVRSNGSITNGSIGSSPATLLVNGINKIAYAYNGVTGSNALAINGSVVATNSQTFAFTQALSRVNVALSEIDLITVSNQRIRALELHPNRIPNTAAPGVLSLATLTAL